MERGRADAPAGATDGSPRPSTPTAASRALLEARRRGESGDDAAAALAAMDEAALAPLRTDRDVALAFWLNCYNAATQRLLESSPELYAGPLRVVRFFRAPAVTVGGVDLSLDRIENGILRGGRSKYGLGYLPKLRTTAFERRYRLTDLDPRVHFALNCGAESCPPIRAYEPDRIGDQLDLATRSYLDATVEVGDGTVSVPRLFLWFRGDFGGGAGIRSFLRRYDAVPADATPSIRYRGWDWTKAAGAFVEGDGRA
jgi:hypothetical protein